MNKLLIILLFLLCNPKLYAQQFLAKSGEISFFSEAPMEDISAVNKKVSAVYDSSTKDLIFRLKITDFIFPKALMQEHFNENYLESDKFPKATFKGDILNFNKIGGLENKCDVKGIMTIHGVSKEIVIPSIFTRIGDTIFVKGEFNLFLEDFAIKIPRLVVKKISKEIKVTFEFNHKPYNR